jgi:hypothetical protein
LIGHVLAIGGNCQQDFPWLTTLHGLRDNANLFGSISVAFNVSFVVGHIRRDGTPPPTIQQSSRKTNRIHRRFMPPRQIGSPSPPNVFAACARFDIGLYDARP